MNIDQSEIDYATGTASRATDEELLEDYAAIDKIKNFEFPEGIPEFIRELLTAQNEQYLELWEPILVAEVAKRGLVTA